MLNNIIFYRKVKVSYLSVSEVSNELINKIVDSFTNLIISSPYLLIPFVCSYFFGYLWSYIILSYFSKKERKILCNIVGRISLGLLWLALVLFFTYTITYGSLEFNIDNLKNIIYTAVIISGAIQAVVFAAIITLYKKG